MGPRTGLDNVGKRTSLILQGLEHRPVHFPTRNQSLHLLRYPGPSLGPRSARCSTLTQKGDVKFCLRQRGSRNFTLWPDSVWHYILKPRMSWFTNAGLGSSRTVIKQTQHQYIIQLHFNRIIEMQNRIGLTSRNEAHTIFIKRTMEILERRSTIIVYTQNTKPISIWNR
jgi:hypothetical protein